MDNGRWLQLKENPMGHLQLWCLECVTDRSRAGGSTVHRLLVLPGSNREKGVFLQDVMISKALKVEIFPANSG
jgi:hypothetical protein